MRITFLCQSLNILQRQREIEKERVLERSIVDFKENFLFFSTFLDAFMLLFLFSAPSLALSLFPHLSPNLGYGTKE